MSFFIRACLTKDCAKPYDRFFVLQLNPLGWQDKNQRRQGILLAFALLLFTDVHEKQFLIALKNRMRQPS